MKSFLFFASLMFSVSLLQAQNFVEVQNTPFENVMIGSVAFEDVDGDGDEDVIISGVVVPFVPKLKLYTNDGGVFSPSENQPFEIVGNGSVVFSDVDGDGDSDVLISGYNFDEEPETTLYLNDTGVFSSVEGNSFIDVAESSVAFADVDNDGDQDLLISGRDNADFSGDDIIMMYLNDSGNFTEVSNTPFEAVEFGSIAFSDVDSDGDPDVLITGRSNDLDAIAKLYLNEGGNFTEDLNSNFTGALESSIDFADIDGDNDPDLIISGLSTYMGPAYTKLYENESGVFTEIMDTPFEDVYRSSLSFADIDGDSDPDLLVSGRNNVDELHTILYTNESGVFTEVMDTPFEGLWWAGIAFADVDGDSFQDLLISGNYSTNSSGTISKLYRNNGLSSFIAEREKLQFEFEVFPNPISSGLLHLSYSSKSNESIRAKIFDVSGKVVVHQEVQIGIDHQVFSIDISALHSGNYVVQLDDGIKMGAKEFVVR